MMTNAPRTGDQACSWLYAQTRKPSKNWHQRCLELARTARSIPSLYPSALSAAHGTPKSERVLNYADLERGMVAYFDDPNDANPYGHIVTVAGWRGPRSNPGNLKVYSNDVVAGQPGSVGIVPGTFFKAHWGDSFLFGATWLNGYNFADLDSGTVTPHPTPLGSDFDAAVASLQKAIRHHRAMTGHSAIVNALTRDLAELKQTRTQFGV